MGQDRFRFEQKLDDYQAFVARRIADGVQRAANNLAPAEIAFGTVEAPEHEPTVVREATRLVGGNDAVAVSAQRAAESALGT